MSVTDWYKYNIRQMTDAEYAKWFSLLSVEKQERVNAFRFYEDKKRTVAGEMLVRKAVAEKFDTAPEDIIIFTSVNGKPYIKNLPVFFNISHSDDYVVCAVSDEEIGIDIEKIRYINPSVAKKFFNAAEIRYVFGGKDPDLFKDNMPEDVLFRFFEVWTYKEACVKFTGNGLSDLGSEIDVKSSKFTFSDYIVTIVTARNKA